MRIDSFACNICNQDYELCEHKEGTLYSNTVCDPSITKFSAMSCALTEKSDESRITDLLMIIPDSDAQKYVWYNFEDDSKNKSINLQIAKNQQLAPENVLTHFAKLLSFATGIISFPPDPSFVLKKGYRVDMVMDSIEIDEKKSDEENHFYFSFNLGMDKTRYEEIQIDGLIYLFDRFDRIVFPKYETMDFYMDHFKGTPLFWMTPEQDTNDFIQDRIEKLRKNFYKSGKYKFSDKSEEYLSNYDDKIIGKYVILSIDIVGSTNLSLELSHEDYTTIVELYTQEMDSIIQNYHGLILKHVGDGIVAYFPVPYFWGTEDIAIDCAVTMKMIIEKGINPILKNNNLRAINFKIGLDFGEVSVHTVGGQNIKMHKDLLGKTINIVAKIQSVGEPGNITIGHNLLQRLHVSRRQMFQKLEKDWDYRLNNDGKIYEIYKLNR